MKRMRLRLRAAAAVMLAGLALVGCDQKGNEAKHIKVGVINGAEQDVAEVAKKVAKESTVWRSSWWGSAAHCCPTSRPTPGISDANVFQHRPFLEQDNKAHNYISGGGREYLRLPDGRLFAQDQVSRRTERRRDDRVSPTIRPTSGGRYCCCKKRS
ncbi:cytoplasmic membrane lipoprotein-28 [Klebsiella pneumoniae]|uniref:Cytoplasmic membrane lipoprotein-28 n=1 Tax=Klebsiella pneumoniae TaxID=573 RepID=A0A2X3FNN6_KLEPN|nr:cytoplasmic membrane lipoprotein-28 [Klebsiella pneumoniae]